MGETYLSLEFLDRSFLEHEELKRLDCILGGGSKYVELPWRGEPRHPPWLIHINHGVDGAELACPATDVAVAPHLTGPEVTPVQEHPQQFMMHHVYPLQTPLYAAPQYSPNHHLAMLSQEMMYELGEAPPLQPPPLDTGGKRGRRGHQNRSKMIHQLQQQPPRGEGPHVLERMGEPLHQMPVPYHQGHPSQGGGVYGHPFGAQYPPALMGPAPVFVVCQAQPQGFYSPVAQGHPPPPFMTTVVPPARMGSLAPPTSTAGGEEVVPAHFADALAAPVEQEQHDAALEQQQLQCESGLVAEAGTAEETTDTMEPMEEVEETAPSSTEPDEKPTAKESASNAVSSPLVEQTVEEKTSPSPVVNGTGTSQKCWADLFKRGSSAFTSEKHSTAMAIPPAGKCKATSMEDSRPLHGEALDVARGKALHGYVVNHTPPLIQPRGLDNGKNWCYINANLQALLACPAFYNLMYSLPVANSPRKGSSETPLIECLLYFLGSYTKALVPGKKEDCVIGSSYDPEHFRDLLMKVKLDWNKGKQEDAEEFLSFILNGLHDEMVSLMRLASNGVNGQCNGETKGHMEEACQEEDPNNGAWCLVSHRNRNLVTRSAEYSPSPLMDIFGGEMRSCLTADGESSASLQPFFTLQLDIQDGVQSVEDALAHMAAEEVVQHYWSSKSNQEVEARRRTTLEKLPQVLILHLKRFVYDVNGGCKKLMNAVHIPHQLTLDRKLVSSERLKHRSYQLFAVLSHSGERTDKGHYVTDAFHPARRLWLRCDDDNVTPLAQGDLPRFDNSSLVPYLLFYRRLDTDPRAR